MESAKKYKYMAFILLQSVIYGFGNPLTKIAFETITPFWSLAVRFTTAFLVFILFFGKRIAASMKTVEPKVYLPAGLCMAAAYITCNLALNWTSSTNVGFLMSLPVIFAPILALLVYKVKYKLVEGFTSKYNVYKLIYYDLFGDILSAITREKQIKGWTREKKIKLIESMNPGWKDLYDDLL
jgi:uncharacterized membrane protein